MVVANSSPLIYLAALGDFALLEQLFGEVAVPQAVYREVVIEGSRFPAAEAVTVAAGRWVHVGALHEPSAAVSLLQLGLQQGESEAIALGQELRCEGLLIDDSDAVSRARALGLTVVRTPGVYRLAKEQALIPAVAPQLDRLRRAGSVESSYRR